MKRSFFLYSNGTLKRKDNTITFINEKAYDCSPNSNNSYPIIL